MVEIDWSAEHSKHREGALNAKAMSVGYGGSQSKMRNTMIERVEGFLGPGAVLKVGEYQELIYREGCDPPHFSPDAPLYDIEATEGTEAVEGYLNKPKGFPHLLWERGLYHDEMIKDIKKDDKKGRDQSYSMVHVSHHLATHHN